MNTAIRLLLVCLFSPVALSAEFTKGPVIKNYGGVAEVIQSSPLTGEERFKVAFDVAEQGESGKANRRFESLARFLNMQARAGVPPEQVELALVVHGKAGFDLLASRHYREKFGGDNPNAPLLAALQKYNVRVYLCGQSAAYHGIENAQLLPGVNMALSAMTAHALLQQQGYTLNPF
ncbi:DsrE family protein [Microbulbifer sp. SA54]|uniref:DsrE family protein n=1 Tax=Microbulbifer sp. SA54 TaxID=3401577 RepID=UPI003AAEECF5